ncbi:MAG TPA: sensor domain-containing diguanylate cyclase [Longimicrobiaceae bacterium]
MRLLLAQYPLAADAPEPPAAPGIALLEYAEGTAPAGGPVEGGALRSDGRQVAFVLDFGEPNAFLLVGAGMGTLPRGGGGSDLLARAAAGAGAWTRERAREQKRLRLVERLMDFSERLGGARTTAEVHEVLLGHSALIVEAYTSVLFVARDGDAELRFAASPLNLGGELRIPRHSSFSRPGLIRASEVDPDTGSPFGPLAPLFERTGAVAVAYAPLAGTGVLFLVERRADRVFDPDDWHLLHVLTRQAESALERIRLLEEVRELSLTDPLTGLANRRQLDGALDRCLAAAHRGEPLSAVLVDIDDFKAINDRSGHLAGDQILRDVATCLREQVRGCDVAVRYGGDEFLLLLPGTCLSGAATLVERIRERMEGRVRLSAGAAEYDTSMRTSAELIAAADRDLYADKRRRKKTGASPRLVTARHPRKRA